MGQADFHAVPATAVEGYEGLFKHIYDSGESKSKLEESIQTVKRTQKKPNYPHHWMTRFSAALPTTQRRP